MIERDFNYINGNTAVQPKRKIEKKDKEKLAKVYKREKLKREKLKRQKTFKKSLSVVQIALLSFTLGSVIIMRDSKVYTLKSNLKTLSNEMKEVTEENEAMRVSLLKNSSLKNIEENAKERINMIESKDADKVELDLSKNYLGELIK